MSVEVGGQQLTDLAAERSEYSAEVALTTVYSDQARVNVDLLMRRMGNLQRTSASFLLLSPHLHSVYDRRTELKRQQPKHERDPPWDKRREEAELSLLALSKSDRPD